MLATLDEKRNSYVAPLVLAYNVTRHDSTGFSRHYLMFGYHPRLAIDAFLRISSLSEKEGSRTSYAKKLKKGLDFA